MNCRQARESISPYLDQQLTGEEMLAMQEHLHRCQPCTQEYCQVREVRILLRSLSSVDPAKPVETQIAYRVAQAERERASVLWPSCWPHNYAFAMEAPLPPQRGRRLAGALALSCIGLLALAVPFAPSTGDAATVPVGANMIAPQGTDAMVSAFRAMPPRNSVSLQAFAPAPLVPPQNTFPSHSLSTRTGASLTMSSWSAEPLGDEAVIGYAAGEATQDSTHGQ